MANIKVNDIKPAGHDLFAGSESFLSDVRDDRLSFITGGKFTGKWWHWTATVPIYGTVVVVVASTQGDC